MFYTDSIGIIERTSGFVNEHGQWIDGNIEIVDSLKCDVQPYTNDLAYKEYGYDGNVQYEIYCPVDERLTLNGKIYYNDKMFTIVTMQVWNDYMVIVVGDKDD